MQKVTNLKTNDNYTIYGVLDSSEKNKNLVIFVHGLTSSPYDHLYYNAALYFPQKGYSTYRFSFSSYEADARKFKDQTIQLRVDDLKLIIDEFKDRYEKIFLVGHSMGGPVIMSTDLSAVTAIVLWEPTFSMKDFREYIPFDKNYNAYILDSGQQIIFSEKMLEEFNTFIEPLELIKKVNKPIKFIAAGKNAELLEGIKQYYEKAIDPKELFIIENAHHTFDEEGAEGKLYEETLKWLNRF